MAIYANHFDVSICYGHNTWVLYGGALECEGRGVFGCAEDVFAFVSSHGLTLDKTSRLVGKKSSQTNKDQRNQKQLNAETYTKAEWRHSQVEFQTNRTGINRRKNDSINVLKGGKREKMRTLCVFGYSAFMHFDLIYTVCDIVIASFLL